MNLKHLAFLLVLMAVLPSPAAAYYGASLDVSAETGQFCPCGIISSNEILIELTNYGTKTDTYFLTMDLPDGWTGFILPEVTLASGENALIDPVWVTPPCGTEPGTYTLRFTAVSAMSGKVIEEELDLDILKCHDVSLSGDDYVDSCEASDAAIPFEVTNNGKTRETFAVIASPEWATVYPETVTLDPFESKTVYVKANPGEGVLGDQEIFVNAQSTTTYASDEKKVIADFEKCYLFDTAITPLEDTVCLGDSVEFNLDIDNDGTKSDTYKIVTPSWVRADESTVTVGSDSRKSVRLTATPPSAGDNEITVYVSSADKPTSIKMVSSILSATDCSKVDVSFSPAQRDVCMGEETSFIVRVENTGNVMAEAMLDASIRGTISEKKVMLEPGESQNLVLDVDGTEREGAYPIDIDAYIGERKSDSDSATVIVHRCYDSLLAVDPPEKKICRGDTDVTYDVEIKNTGEKKDSFTFTYPQGTSDFVLEAGETKKIEAKVKVNEEWGTMNDMLFTLESANGVDIEQVVPLDVASKDECYAADLSILDGDTAKETEVPSLIGYGSIVEMKLVNTGLRPDTYFIKASGPAWSYTSTKSVHLAPLQEEDVYLYLSPPDGTALGEYEITMLADSEYASSEVRVTTTVTDELPDEELEELVETGTLVEPGVLEGLAGMFVAAEPVSFEITLLTVMAFLTVLLVVLRFIIFR